MKYSSPHSIHQHTNIPITYKICSFDNVDLQHQFNDDADGGAGDHLLKLEIE